jgi:hypothetical protein
MHVALRAHLPDDIIAQRRKTEKKPAGANKTAAKTGAAGAAAVSDMRGETIVRLLILSVELWILGWKEKARTEGWGCCQRRGSSTV